MNPWKDILSRLLYFFLLGCPPSHLPKMNKYSDYKMLVVVELKNQYIYFLVFTHPSPWLHNTSIVLCFLEGGT